MAQHGAQQALRLPSCSWCPFADLRAQLTRLPPAGFAQIGLEVVLPARGDRPTFIAMPAMNDLSSMCMWQTARSARGKAAAEEEAPLCQASFGNTVVLGVVSALVQNW